MIGRTVYLPTNSPCERTKLVLVGGFNPSEKYARQIGNLPQIGVRIKHILNHHLE